MANIAARMRSRGRWSGWLAGTLSLLLVCGVWLDTGDAEPRGTVTYAMHVTLAPTWFDPGEVPGGITPYMVLYAFSDALVKPMPDGILTPSLATSWEKSDDDLSYTFHLRQGVTFHNGDPFTAEDVKFSFDRYKGAGSSLMKRKVKDVEIIDPHTVRFVLSEPWPDFLTYYGTPATGAGWIVPKKYVEEVGTDGYKNKPIGAGPFMIKDITPGVEVVFEAYEQYWRQVPKVKTIIMKSVKEGATRLAMLKRGEADIAYKVDGPLAEEVKSDPNLTLAISGGLGVFWLEFLEQSDPESPWHDKRVRLAASYAIDRQAISDAETLGLSPSMGNIVPSNFQFYKHFEPHEYDPEKAKQLLKEAGYARGFDAGHLTPVPPYYSFAEAIAGYLGAIGIRVQVQKMERAVWFSRWRKKELTGLCLCASGSFGNAATRLENFITSDGQFSTISYPDIDDLFAQQSKETDPEQRKALLDQIQDLWHERVMHAPIYALMWPNGVGSRVKEAGMGLIKGFYYTGPFEDIELK